MRMKRYAVIHGPSGKYLPPKPSQAGTATKMELGAEPRLFRNVRNAVCAARWWCKGVTGYVDDGFDFDLMTTPKPERKLSELFVISVHLMVSKNKWRRKVIPEE